MTVPSMQTERASGAGDGAWPGSVTGVERGASAERKRAAAENCLAMGNGRRAMVARRQRVHSMVDGLAVAVLVD